MKAFPFPWVRISAHTIVLTRDRKVTANNAPTSSIFISYRHDADSELAASRLAEDLRRHFAREQVFQDFTSIDPGADFVEVLERGLEICAAVLVVIGPNWLGVGGGEGDYWAIDMTAAAGGG